MKCYILASGIIMEILSKVQINESFSEWIAGLVSNDMSITIITTLVGIIIGFASTFNHFWRNFSIILCAIIFNIFMILRMIFISEPWYTVVISLVLWLITCIFIIKKMEGKEIVSRRKIGKMIVEFTATANPSKEVCIFAGDIDFFGEVVEPSDSTPSMTKGNNLFVNLKNKKKNKEINKRNIKNNNQFLQLKNKNFRNICILCIKPPQKDENIKDDYHKDRIRIGFLKNELGARVHFKFFNDQCDNCLYGQNNTELYQCSFKSDFIAKEESDRGNTCNHISLPDTTLRGRIVTNRETDAKCVAITTKKSSRKAYILREYGANEKESYLYTVIWRVWWTRCEEDEEFVKSCQNEYNDSTK